MHEALTAQVHANVGHLPLNIEEQQVSGLQLAPADCIDSGPQLSGGARDAHAGLRVGILHQATAVEAVWTAASVAIGDSHLFKGNSCRTLSDGKTLCRLGDRRVEATAG